MRESEAKLQKALGKKVKPVKKAKKTITRPDKSGLEKQKKKDLDKCKIVAITSYPEDAELADKLTVKVFGETGIKLSKSEIYRLALDCLKDKCGSPEGLAQVSSFAAAIEQQKHKIIQTRASKLKERYAKANAV